MNGRIILIAAASAALLSACASISAAPPGPQTLGGVHGVTLGQTWSDVTAVMPTGQPSVRLLTMDGPMLNRLYLVGGLSRGQGLIKAVSKEKPVPTYRADMSPSELAEFTADTVVALGYQRVQTAKLRPAKFGAVDGLRFDIKAQTDSGLEISGVAQLCEDKEKLFLVLYLAPTEHYFAASLPEVEALLKSAT